MGFLALISAIPLLLLLYDGYKVGDMKKGFIQILIFFIAMGIGAILIKNYGLRFAIFIPSILVAYVLLVKKKQKE